jgi:hypothetical protein
LTSLHGTGGGSHSKQSQEQGRARLAARGTGGISISIIIVIVFVFVFVFVIVGVGVVVVVHVLDAVVQRYSCGLQQNVEGKEILLLEGSISSDLAGSTITTGCCWAGRQYKGIVLEEFLST